MVNSIAPKPTRGLPERERRLPPPRLVAALDAGDPLDPPEPAATGCDKPRGEAVLELERQAPDASRQPQPRRVACREPSRVAGLGGHHDAPRARRIDQPIEPRALPRLRRIPPAGAVDGRLDGLAHRVERLDPQLASL